MTTLHTPPMQHVEPGIDLQDGRVRFFTRAKAPRDLSQRVTLQKPTAISPGGRSQTLPAGTVVRVVGVHPETAPDIEDDDAPEIVQSYRLLWEVE